MTLYLALRRLDVTIQTCVIGNDRVGSSGDNVPTGVAINSMWASQDTYEKPQGELLINLVTIKWRKTVDTPWPKWQVVRKWCFNFIISMLVVRPGNRESLRVSITSVKWNVVNPNNLLNNNNNFPFEECVGSGCWKKRTYSCNSCDRAVLHRKVRELQEYPIRKDADFQLVLTIVTL